MSEHTPGKRMTVAQAVKATGRSETWLRTHSCAWCDQTALGAIRGDCSAVESPKCTPEQAIKKALTNNVLAPVERAALKKAKE